jgi:hypothetical protein
MRIRIKNWANFQHYRDRNPPWIKLHRRLLDDREFFNLDGACVKTLVLLWILAAETTDGHLPAIEDIAFRLRIDSKLLASQISQLNHWIIVDASVMLADCLHDASDMHTNAIPETETETETETENRVTRARAHDVVDHEFDTFWKTYPKKSGKKAALKAFQKARKSGMPSIDGVVAAIEQQRSCDQWKRDNGQYIPNPTTWLNQGRWDDELKEGHGRKLLPQEETQAMLQEWLEEEEMKESNGKRISREVLTADIGGLPRKVEADKTDGLGVERAIVRRR